MERACFSGVIDRVLRRHRYHVATERYGRQISPRSITSFGEGRFDHLALLFPTKLQNADLLMRALKQWLFRPATRDGTPTEVEILLIIPNQVE